MDVQDLLAQAGNNMSVTRVYGQPYERDGVTVIPAAIIRGTAGGGSGEREDGEHAEQQGEGAGLALTARPAGALVIRGNKVSWRPAVDVNRIVMGGQVVAVVALLTALRIVRAVRAPRRPGLPVGPRMRRRRA